eukprot:gene61859-biopygen30604
MPSALDTIQRRLTAVQDVIYFGNEQGPDTIRQAVGLTQGQATSGQLYSLGIQPLNNEIAVIANQLPGAAVSAYIDDVKTHTSAQLVEQIIELQLSKGLAYGAFLKMDKHRILLEVCSTDGDAQGEVAKIAAEWRLAFTRLKGEPHYLWYLLRNILGSKFTYLFRGIAPEYAQPLADCLTLLQRETCEILAQCETISDLSFDIARIQEGAGLGFADDIPECAFAASKLASLRSIESANAGFVGTVKEVYAHPETADATAIPLPARQLASALRAVDPTFLLDDRMSAEYKDLRKLQGLFLRPRKELRTEAVETQLNSNNVLNTIYLSGKSKEAGAWLGAIPKTEALTILASEFQTAFRNRLLIPHPQLIAHETCGCGKEVDTLGVHVQKCKLDGHLTNNTHNRLVACVAEMARSCGQTVRVEVSGIFNNVDPSSHKRMDLVVHDPGKPNRLYDLVITNPVTQKVLQSSKVNLQRIKERRYRELATEAGMLLHGAAIEVY